MALFGQAIDETRFSDVRTAKAGDLGLLIGRKRRNIRTAFDKRRRRDVHKKRVAKIAQVGYDRGL